MKRHAIWTAACIVGGLLAGSAPVRAGEEPAKTPATAPATRPAAKPITQNIQKAVGWLVNSQNKDGSWGQGEESSQMGGGAQLKSTPNVADTCMALMAMVHAGQNPKEGDHSQNVINGINFVCAQIEDSDEKSLFCTSLRGTRTQSKLGTYIDTFLAAQMLGEVKNVMHSEAATKRVADALAKIVKKIETNQKEDGRWAADGWAPALAQGQAAKALNIAAMSGVTIDEKVRERAEKFARADYQSIGAAAKPSAGSAGVELYSRAGQLTVMNASDAYNLELRKELETIVAAPTTKPEEKQAAQQRLASIKENEKDLADATKVVIDRMKDARFVAGFGNNGGEEFLSHLNIGEALYQRGGEDWTKWDQGMTANINNIQNADGSWSGHHCITGRTFCTSAALMVLCIDRAPTAIGGKIKRQ
jgi:hypothetical protein